jgi:hypothetical protein
MPFLPLLGIPKSTVRNLILKKQKSQKQLKQFGSSFRLCILIRAKFGGSKLKAPNKNLCFFFNSSNISSWLKFIFISHIIKNTKINKQRTN